MDSDGANQFGPAVHELRRVVGVRDLRIDAQRRLARLGQRAVDVGLQRALAKAAHFAQRLFLGRLLTALTMPPGCTWPYSTEAEPLSTSKRSYP